MDPWGYGSEGGKGFVSDGVNSPTDSFLRSKHSLAGWEPRNPCGFGNMLVSEQFAENQSAGDLEFPETVGKQVPDSFSAEAEPSSKLSGSVGDSNSQDSLLIDLKLGRFGDQRETHCSQFSEAAPILSSSESSRPPKRMRASAVAPQAAFCQVYGCNKDLRSSKEYHKRHKVCEVHTKTAKVIVNGREQRFCQQCSRFHLLDEFDDGKRSCRKRLTVHNERRRKPHVPIHNGRTAGRLQKATLVSTSLFRQEISSTNPELPEKYLANDWCRHMNIEKSYYRVPSAIPMINGNLLSKSILPSYGAGTQASVFRHNGVSTATENMFSDSSQYVINVGAPHAGSFALFHDSSLASDRFSVLDAASSINGLSGISEPGCALSLLSSQSHDSSHPTGIPLASPLTLLSSQPHYSTNNLSATGVSSHVSKGAMFSKSTASTMNVTEASQLAANFEMANAMSLGSEFVNNEDRLPFHGSATIDLLQLSSRLQRLEHQRQTMQVKQEDNAFC